MGHDQPLIVAVDGNIAIVTLNRPGSFNAFNAELRTKFASCVREMEQLADVRVVVLHGAGPGFCAGADLSEGMTGSVADQLGNEYKPFLVGIASSSKIWIAAIHGSAAGIGGALAMTCDLVVMAQDANIYLAFAALGLVPDGGATWHLLQAMGYKRALQTVLEGRKIPAAECLATGLVNKVVPAGAALGASLDWARALSTGAPLAQAAAKQVLRACHGQSLSEAISSEATAQEALVKTKDFRAGVAAFFAKRKPQFSGC